MPKFSNTRSAVVMAPPARIHALLNDFHEWAAWSPWEPLDPDMKRSYSGASSGVGAQYAWEGNKKVGTGRMEITESTSERIALDLEFLAPFKAQNTSVFQLTPVGDSTTLSWTMSGQRNALMALMGRLYFDRAISKDFDKGLASIKRLAET